MLQNRGGIVCIHAVIIVAFCIQHALIGYICGISAKIVQKNYNLAFIFYIINTCMVTIDILLWIRNYRYEQEEPGNIPQSTSRRI